MKELPDKVTLAILDKDLKARTFRKFPLTSDGTKIDVVNAGKGYFMPRIDNDSFIELPSRSMIPPFKRKWDRIYVAIRGAKACINFRTEEVYGPDPQQVVDAAKSELITNFGKEKQDTPMLVYFNLVLNVLIFLILIGVINI